MLVATKSTGDSYTASENNQVNDETENSISDTGQTPSAGNLVQQSTAMSIYAAGGAFYTDSGAADAYVLTTVGSKRAPIAYFDGMIISFRAGNENTGASTVNVSGLGVKTIQNNAAAVDQGDILDSNLTTAVYNASSGFFDLTSVPTVGSIIQIVNVTDGDLATGTTVMPQDDSIPQITEGDEYMTLAVTPVKATNKLRITVTAYGAHSTSTGGVITALFQDATADALAALFGARNAAVDANSAVTFSHIMTAGTTSSTTFRVRIGNQNAGTTTFNGRNAARLLGGVMASSITIEEIEV